MSGKTILFWPESAYGPTNNCIGIGNVLKNRGHNVVFAAESSWGGRLSPLGFQEELVDLSAHLKMPMPKVLVNFGKISLEILHQSLESQLLNS